MCRVLLYGENPKKKEPIKMATKNTAAHEAAAAAIKTPTKPLRESLMQKFNIGASCANDIIRSERIKAGLRKRPNRKGQNGPGRLSKEAMQAK
jgi:hypothetical protein